MKQSRKRLVLPLVLIALCCGIVAGFWSNSSKATAKDTTSLNESKGGGKPVNSGLEIPVFTTRRPSQVIEHVGYTVSFNPTWRTPNWVAYELTRAETEGLEERSGHFDPDPAVKGVCPNTRDYSNSGFDRGHMAPAADMKWSEQAMRESFYLTNICPQNHNLNAGDWRILEEKVRDWAVEYGRIYVVCGPLTGAKPQVIGDNDVAVPDAFYKVLLCEINGNWQAIGFYFLNQAGHKPLSTYCKSVDEIEQLTGLDFFSKLEDKVENKVEAHYDINTWNIK